MPALPNPRHALLCAALLAATHGLAQPGALDPTFLPGTGANFTVSGIQVQPDGRVVIAGAFTSFNGTSVGYIARLHPSGALDPSFTTGSGFNGTVFQMIGQPDGKMLLLGNFTAYNGTPLNAPIARLLGDGTLDPDFTPPSMATSTLNRMRLMPDGRILVASSFSPFGMVFRLQPNGTIDGSFSTSNAINGPVFALAVRSDGSVLVSGVFTTVNGQPRAGLALLQPNGALNTGFDPGLGATAPPGPAPVQDLACRPSGEFLLSGPFTAYNGTPVNKLVQVLGTGAIDPSFNTGTGFNETVTRLQLLPDGRLWCLGSFTSYNGNPAGGLCRLNANGSMDAVFNPSPGSNSTVLVVQPDGNERLYVGGNYTQYAGVARSRIARVIDCTPVAWYADADGDGFGNPAYMIVTCPAPAGYVADNTDCNDSDPQVNGPQAWYLDADGDGFGNPDSSTLACTPPAGFVGNATDCDDSEFLIYPGAACDDGDPLTGNDAIQPYPGCACAGTSLSLSARLFLSGPYSVFSGMMADDLRVQGLIPLTEPYTALGYDAVGSPSPAGSVFPASLLQNAPVPLDDVVDWVILELRDANDPAIRIATRYVLVKRFGYVIDLDGGSTVRFPVPPGNYRLAALHRNHRGVVMAQGAPLHGAFVDFTSTSLEVLGGGSARKSLGVPYLGLFAGDATFNDNIKYVGADNDRDPILVAIGGNVPTNIVSGVYAPTDVNLDGLVKYTGANNDRDPILESIGGTVPTNVLPNIFLHTTP